MTLNNSIRSERIWTITLRLVWLLTAAVAFGVFFASLARLFSASPWADCPTAQTGCQLNQVTYADVQMMLQMGLPASLITGLTIGSSLVARLSLALVGVLIFVLRPDDRLAWLMSLVLLTGLTEGITQLGRLQILADVLFAIGVLGWLPLPFIFPNGRIEPRWLLWPVIVLSVVIFPVWQPALAPVLPRWMTVLVYIGSAIWSLLGVYSMIYRYRHVSNAVERQQTKWVVIGFLAVFITSTTYSYLQALYPPWQPSSARVQALMVNGAGYVIGYLTFAISLAFAMLRYRLWDIDVVIRRTLQYTLLTGLLALIYFGAVVVLQFVFRGLTGQNNAAIIVSTLLIAALFQPLRTRLQRFIDRRFYRRKYDAAQALAAFAVSARDDIDLSGVTSRLLAVVEDTVQPVSSVVWLRPLAQEPAERQR